MNMKKLRTGAAVLFFVAGNEDSRTHQLLIYPDAIPAPTNRQRAMSGKCFL